MVLDPRSICHRIKCSVGRTVDCLPLNHVIYEQTSSGRFYRKARHWYGDQLIQASSLLGMPFAILPQRDWFAREQDIHRQVYGEDVLVDANGYLVMPARPGQQLATFLDDPDHDQQTKFQALACVVGALWELHQLVVIERCGVYRLFSHADAIVANVTYDLATDTAWWFDFETIHPADRPLAWRRADDLRALAYSAAAHLPLPAAVHLAELVISAYSNQNALHELAGIAATLQHCPGIFHLGQTHIDYERSQVLHQSFRQIIHPG